MQPLTMASDQLRVTFGENPLHVVSMVHRSSGRMLCAGGEQTFLIRLPRRLSDPVFLGNVEAVEIGDKSLRFDVADDSDVYRATCTIEVTEDGLRYGLAVTAPEPVWMAEWSLRGLALQEIVVPALGGQVLTHELPADKELSYKYPFWWNAQFAVGFLGLEGGVWLRTKQREPGFKVFRAIKVDEAEQRFALSLGFEADAPVTSNTLTAEWYVEGYDGSWEQPVDKHRGWLEQSFGLQPYREHAHFPDWAGDINFVLEIWGMNKSRGRPAHTFEQMAERIEAFAGLHPPERTLLYLPGFAENGIDSNAPDYNPSPHLGGVEGFRRLVERAHELGYRVMIHTNVLAMTYTHPLFPDFEEYQVVDAFERPLGWGLDMDGDWLPEPYFAYIHPGAAAWGELMESVLGELITGFDLDAVFLDQTLLAFNVSRGANFVEGMCRHIRRLQQAFPDVLFAGEGMHEQVLPVLPMAQIHGVDSIADIHNPEGVLPGREVHPVSTYLFGRYTRFTAHLLTKHPSSSIFARQEAAYADLGVIPALVLYRPSHEVDGPAVRKMLERARRLEGHDGHAAGYASLERRTGE